MKFGEEVLAPKPVHKVTGYFSGLILFTTLLILLGAGGEQLQIMYHPDSSEGGTVSHLQRSRGEENVEEVGAYMERGLSARSVYVAGDYAYLIDGDLHIINVSDPAAPTKVGTYIVPGDAWDVYVSGPYAYVADIGMWSSSCGCYEGGGLRVIDVSDPTAPVEVGAFLRPVMRVFVAGHYAYIGGLRVLDMSDPTAPVEVGAVSVPGGGGGIYIAGSYAYVSSEDHGLEIIDVSDPTTPRQTGAYLGSVPAGTFPSVYVAGAYAYMTVGVAGVEVIDVSDPMTPRQVGAYVLPPPDAGYANSVQVVGNFAYVTSDWGIHPFDSSTIMASEERVVLQVLDVTDPAAPVEVASYTAQGSAMDVHVGGDYAYVAYDNAGRVGGLLILRFTEAIEATPTVTPTGTAIPSPTPTATVTVTSTAQPTATGTAAPPSLQHAVYLPYVTRRERSD